MEPLTPDAVAEIVHETNRLITLALGQPAQPHWAEAPQRMRDDTRHMVEHTLAHPDKTPEQDHEEWVRAKQAAGWVWGPVKDEAAKTHPMIVPYAELPPGEHLKNRALPALILALMAR